MNSPYSKNLLENIFQVSCSYQGPQQYLNNHVIKTSTEHVPLQDSPARLDIADKTILQHQHNYGSRQQLFQLLSDYFPSSKRWSRLKLMKDFTGSYSFWMNFKTRQGQSDTRSSR